MKPNVIGSESLIRSCYSFSNMQKALFFIIISRCFVMSSCAQHDESADWINTSIGVVKKGSNCTIGPRLPYGSISPCPQSANGGNDGYDPTTPVYGFGQIHVSGTGWGSYGHFLISPQVGLSIDPSEYASPHTNEITKAYHYKVNLHKYNLTTEITSAHYSSMYRFTYPASGESSILFDATQAVFGDIILYNKYGKLCEIAENEAEINPKKQQISGKIRYKGGWPEDFYTLYFVAKINKKFDKYGTWNSEKIYEKKRNAKRSETKNEHLGCFCTFKTVEGEQVLMKVAISFQSYENAEALLDREIPDWDFNRVQNEARRIWNEKLSSINVDTNVVENKIKFYSAMFRAYTFASDRTLDKPLWVTKNTPYWDDIYAIWDLWKTLYPLLTLVDHDAVRGNIDAILDRFGHFGYVRDGFIAGMDKLPNQGGDNIDNVLADAYFKGIKGVDWEKVYQVMKHNADNGRNGSIDKQLEDPQSKINNSQYKQLGWIPYCRSGNSKALEYSYNDYCVAQVAFSLGHIDDYKRYIQRSKGWINMWNPNLKDEKSNFTGFLDGKDHNDNFKYIDPRTILKPGPFYEGTSWTYSFSTAHTIPSVIELTGGKDKYAERLNYAFENNLIKISNEPGFLVAKTFSDAGRPDLNSYWTHYIMNNHYDLEGYPGNEDTGAMGSWYIFSSMGLFPNAGQPYYYLSAPVFDKVTIKLADGKIFTIVSENVSEENIYIKSCRLDGKEINSPIISHNDIINGSILTFILSDIDCGWGR